MSAEEEQKLGLTTPAGFIYRVLLQAGIELAQWQADFANKFRDPTCLVKAALSTPNGSGKSSILVAGLALWWISIFKLGKVVIESFDSKQLDHQCWPSIEAHRSRFENEKGWRFIEREVHTPDGAFIVGFTTDDPGRAEGWHKIDDLDGPLLMLFDEAKSIDTRVFEAGDRCTYNALGYISSTGFNEGRFWDAFTVNQKTDENPLGFDTMKVGLADCPWIPKSRIDSTIAQYGIDHPFTQSTLFGEFMDQDADTIFVVNRSVAKAALEAKPIYVHGGRAAYCDFAAGRNENVLAFKEGNKVELVCWRDANTMSSVGRFLIEFRKRHLHPSETYGDAGGMGKVFIDRFHELGWPIIPVRNDEVPVNPIYKNRGCEDWHEGAKKMGEQSYILPNDPILYKQMTSRRMDFKGGLLGMETKEEMAKRGVESPDRADGVFGVLGVDTALKSALMDEKGLRRLESMARVVTPEPFALTLSGETVQAELNAKDSWLDVWERPIFGRHYLLVVDPFWHDDLFGSHVVIVLRAGYFDEQKKAQPARLVAKVRKPCRMDGGPLAQTVRTLSKWYGDCFIIPVQNERGDVIEAMLAAGLGIYAKQDFEHIRHGRSEIVQFGWENNEYNRSLWIGALAEAVRNNLIDCQDIESVMQMFQVSADNAKEKRDAEAIGVGLKEITFATRCTQKKESPFKEERKPKLAAAMYS